MLYKNSLKRKKDMFIGKYFKTREEFVRKYTFRNLRDGMKGKNRRGSERGGGSPGCELGEASLSPQKAGFQANGGARERPKAETERRPVALGARRKGRERSRKRTAGHPHVCTLQVHTFAHSRSTCLHTPGPEPWLTRGTHSRRGLPSCRHIVTAALLSTPV